MFKTLKTITKPFTTAALAALIASGSMIAPANAGGSLLVKAFTGAGNPREASAIQTALAVYSIIKAQKKGRDGRPSAIYQVGSNNTAGLNQNGYGNQGIVYQEGSGHNGSIRQNGNNNSHALLQFGKNTNAHVIQNGHGQSGVTFVFGW